MTSQRSLRGKPAGMLKRTHRAAALLRQRSRPASTSAIERPTNPPAFRSRSSPRRGRCERAGTAICSTDATTRTAPPRVPGPFQQQLPSARTSKFLAPAGRARSSVRGYSRHATSSPRRDAVRILRFSLAALGKGQGAPKGTVLSMAARPLPTCGRLPARPEAAFMQCRAAL